MIVEFAPVGFVRLSEEGAPLCDLPERELYRIIMETDCFLWNGANYEITDEGRAYVKARFLN